MLVKIKYYNDQIYIIASDYYEFYFEANLDIKIYISEYNKSNATK